MNIIETVNNLIERSGSLCINFSSIKKEISIHSQTLTNLLKKGEQVGLIVKCKDLGLGENGYTALPIYVVSLEYKVVNEIVDVTDKFIIMKHTIENKLYNNSSLPLRGATIKIFGDVCVDKPVTFIGREYKQIHLEESIDKYYIFNLDSDVEIKSGEIYTYKYEFYLKYFPPMDYFIIEPFNITMLFRAKTYLTKSGKKVIKSVRLEYLPNIRIIKENQGKTYHEVEIIKIQAFKRIKFWFNI
ncbi:hypothetical protein HS5_07100 [Acidianus sp. HS-5]|nr:hypothetical protein HS5_07100 [Acidianus sp. HS-5]